MCMYGKTRTQGLSPYKVGQGFPPLKIRTRACLVKLGPPYIIKGRTPYLTQKSDSPCGLIKSRTPLLGYTKVGHHVSFIKVGP
ncbi:hypothetical protein HanRHA438_Chr10g0454661 [Helianthus annuus]|nr:hypothetical protein HanRHA438_Chr10g0454661 [Helianthus annuus]